MRDCSELVVHINAIDVADGINNEDEVTGDDEGYVGFDDEEDSNEDDVLSDEDSVGDNNGDDADSNDEFDDLSF